MDEASGRDEVDQIFIDLFYLKVVRDKQSWFCANPLIIIDNESDIE